MGLDLGEEYVGQGRLSLRQQQVGEGVQVEQAQQVGEGVQVEQVEQVEAHRHCQCQWTWLQVEQWRHPVDARGQSQSMETVT